MAIFSAYFDASGHPDNTDVLTVAGYVGAVDSWVRFDREWQGILEAEGISAFHTTEFVSSQGEFASWKGREPAKTERRRLTVEKLMGCVEKNCARFFRASVYLPDYERVDAAFMLSEQIGRPYAVCSSSVAYSLRNWANALGALDTLLYYFEDGDKDKGNFEQVHLAAFGTPPRFLEKSKALAFQAADFNAWKMRTALHESNKRTHTPQIGSNLLRSVAVLESVSKEAGVLNEWSLRTLCDRLRIPRR
jgi:hypothetical protein